MLEKNDAFEILNPGMEVNVNPSVFALMKNCQPSTASVEQGYSLLKKSFKKTVIFYQTILENISLTFQRKVGRTKMSIN